ncbi:hypothetical protein CERZMDRAFT_66196 [Cercospora zeae-maydis SCOH1-5]|uniref:AMP-dependent synthetase/ligase domain-containing protein n=1 Tax=Cercospora zeae-maydis SCOH1-5 TaxID=717836 RepID=A0A6A6FNA9_9PEZI|nr:hypothetical protein CERZMDRAFT_66196 [Cercospora zeae-maydis SCOH1-5]
MPIQSTFPDLEIHQCNLLSFLFPDGKAEDDKQLWINAAHPTRSLTASRALHLIKRFACGLDKLDIAKQTPIMVVAPNCIYTPVVYLATIGSGRIFTAANPSYTMLELVHQMKTVQAGLVLADSSALLTVQKAAAEANIPRHRVFNFDSAAESKCDVTSWERILSSEPEAEAWHWDPLEGKASKSTVAVINFSSGTTGLPKGVCTTHYNWIANACQVIHARLHGTGQTIDNPDPNDKWLAFLPWYHAYAQMFTLIVACKLRQAVYTMPQFQLEPYLKYIAQYKITNLQLVPPVLVMMNKRSGIEELDLGSVRWIMSAAAPLKRDLQNEICRKLGATIVQSYGMTETTCTALMVPGFVEDDSGSAGVLLPSTEAMLVDEKGREVEGKSGELWVRGPQMLLNYWENESATKETYAKDGWLKTGDVAEYDAGSGKFWIVDRRKELIKVRGFQVAPAELEALLLEHEDIADAAVVGLSVEDEERPRAYVKLQSPSIEAIGVERGIQRYVAKKAAKHKHLTGGVKIVDQIPRLLSGKIERKVVKEWAKRDAEDVASKTNAAKPKL